jgi:hypothetical protein
VRVALKSASSNAETSQTTGPKSGGESFLDILSQGAQSGVQGTKAASSQAQGDSDAQAQSSEQDQQSANASQASSNQSAAAASSQTAKNANTVQANTVQANSQQNATAGNTQASLNTQASAAAQKIAALLGMVDPLSSQATIDAGSSAQTAQGSGKPATTPAKGAKSDAAPSKGDGAQAANAAALQIAVPTIPDQALGLQKGLQLVDPAAAVTGQANSGDGQASSIAQTPSAKTLADANQQATADAQTFEKNIADATANAAQASAAQDSDAAQTANQNAAQAVAGEFLSAALGTNALSSQGTISNTASSSAKTSNVNFNASGTTYTAANTLAAANASGSNATKKITQDANGSSQSSGDGTQRAQGDGSQSNAPAATRPVDADASQAIAFGTALSSHTGTAQSSTGTGAGTAASTTTDGAAKHTGEANGLAAESAPNAAGSASINSARLIQTMSESEMRVGLRSSEFGDISIRTTVTQQQVQAQISVDHSELASALSGHIATTQAKMGNEFGLHASIEVSHGGASFSSNREQSSSQNDYKPFAASMQIDGAAQSADTTEKLPARPLTSTVQGARLDIRA